MTEIPAAIHPHIRINSYGWYLRNRFNCRVSKVNVDAGFTCPNRDGSRGTGGCIYCDNSSFSPGETQAYIPIEEQMAAGMAYHRRRLGSEKFIVYFQKFTNTYADPEHSAPVYQALSPSGCPWDSIGTRPDAITRKLDLRKNWQRNYVCL
jgi:hypothetical protein